MMGNHTNDYISYEQHLVDAIYLLIAGLVATVGNLITVVTYILDKKIRKKAKNMLLINIAVADLAISIFGYPYSTASSFHGEWLFSEFVCNMYAFCCFMFSMVTVASLVGLSAFRFVILCKRDHVGKLTRKNTIIMIGCCWAYGIFWAGCPLIGWSSYHYEAYGTSCSCNWYSSQTTDVTFNIATILFCFILPLGCLIYFYAKILKLYGRQTPEDLSIPVLRSIKEYHVALMCMMMVVLFMVIWTPYAVFSAIGPFYKLPSFLLPLPSMMAKFSPCCNPLVYYMMNKPYRTAIRRVWCKCKLKVHPQKDQQYYSRRPKEGVFVVTANLQVAFDQQRFRQNQVEIGRQDSESKVNTHGIIFRIPEEIQEHETSELSQPMAAVPGEQLQKLDMLPDEPIKGLDKLIGKNLKDLDQLHSKKNLDHLANADFDSQSETCVKTQAKDKLDREIKTTVNLTTINNYSRHLVKSQEWKTEQL